MRAQASLADPLARLQRADEHFEVHNRELEAFIDRDPLTITHELDQDKGLLVVRANVSETPPLRFGLILGDALHNLRAALDNLAYQLVVHGSGVAPAETAFIGFPIVFNERDFERYGRKRVSGARKPHVAFIESVQPYPERTTATSRALEALHSYNNRDKHRAIHVTFGVFADPEKAARSFRREPVTEEFVFEFDPVGFGKPLEDGMDVAHLRFLPPGSQPEVNMESTLPVEIAFGERGLSMKKLPAIRWEVERLILRFQPDLP